MPDSRRSSSESLSNGIGAGIERRRLVGEHRRFGPGDRLWVAIAGAEGRGGFDVAGDDGLT